MKGIIMESPGLVIKKAAIFLFRVRIQNLKVQSILFSIATQFDFCVVPVKAVDSRGEQFSIIRVAFASLVEYGHW